MPSVVTIAKALIWTLVALFVLRAVLTYALFDSLMDSWVESRSSEVPREVLEDGAPEYKPIALVSAVMLGGVLAVCPVFLTRGADWARKVATFFGVLSVLSGIIGLVQPSAAWSKLLGLTVGLVALAIIVVLWLPAASPFFRPSKATT